MSKSLSNAFSLAGILYVALLPGYASLLMMLLPISAEGAFAAFILLMPCGIAAGYTLSEYCYSLETSYMTRHRSLMLGFAITGPFLALTLVAILYLFGLPPLAEALFFPPGYSRRKRHCLAHRSFTITVKDISMLNTWHDEDYRSWRLSLKKAWLPIKTMDSGWIWLRPYWRWECISGWGDRDDFAYLNKPSIP